MRLYLLNGVIERREVGPGWIRVGPNHAWSWVKFRYLSYNFEKKGIPNSRKKLFKKL